MKKLLVAFLAAGFLAGCGFKKNLPEGWWDDRLARPELQEIGSDREKLTASYMGRWMMESDDREVLFAMINQVEANKSWDALDSHTFGKMTGDVLSSTFGSSLGDAMGVGFMALDIGMELFADGSMSASSEIYVPPVYEGVPISSAAEATQAMSALVEGRFADVSSALGWPVAHRYENQTGLTRWVIVEKPQGWVNPGFPWVPDNMLLLSTRLPAKALPENDAATKILNRDLAWSTGTGNTAVFMAVANIRYGEDGKPVLTRSDDGTFEAPNSGLLMEGTMFGEDVLRKLSSPLNTFGTKKHADKSVFFNGEMYTFVLNSNPLMVKKKNVRPSLLDR